MSWRLDLPFTSDDTIYILDPDAVIYLRACLKSHKGSIWILGREVHVHPACNLTALEGRIEIFALDRLTIASLCQIRSLGYRYGIAPFPTDVVPRQEITEDITFTLKPPVPPPKPTPTEVLPDIVREEVNRVRALLGLPPK
ncbi:MAG: hypothetical protein SP1CHLAM54_04300 [Chlamydiia bacterium]|nr:hypothetical protein [Chlamydiia bacterium]MCH9615344.1 hypothetical protein [Chlamydiia bacterium]MCH9628334.1 hypothetical protein [Chlamydiia bacterium]